MKGIIDMISFNLESSLLSNVERSGDEFTFGRGSGEIRVPFSAVGGRFVVAELENLTDDSAGIIWQFSAADGQNIGFKMGLLPHLMTRIALPFDFLDGTVLFLPRTPGKLKTVTFGRPLPKEAVTLFTIRAGDSMNEAKFIIRDLRIVDEEPDYPLPDVKMVDKLGQKLCTEWPGKTHSLPEMKSRLREELKTADLSGLESETLSRYGGLKSKKFNATGYFRLENDGRRWWMVDPEGCAFFSKGLDCVRIDGDCNLQGIKQLCEFLPRRGSVGWSDESCRFFSFHKYNMYKAFGSDWYEKFCALCKSRMTKWGFNTVACWSDMRLADESGLPFTYIFGGSMLTKKLLFRDFPDVFSPEYGEVCEKWAAQLEPYAENDRLIGYFMGNEPQWAFVNNLNLASLLLESGKELESYKVMIGWLREKYGEIGNLNAAWGTDFGDYSEIAPASGEKAVADQWEFTRMMIREYMRVPAEAIRKIDPNHLNLGIRYAWLSSDALTAGSEFVDVFSFNCYKMDPTEPLDEFYARVGKPMIIGEFHFGALDVGLDATGLRGVTDQHERGVAYRHYMQKAAAHPMCVGAHYFTLNDQAYLGRFDGENYQIGLVDVCQRPYEDFVAGVELANGELYEIADGKLPTDAPKAKEIPAIAF